MAAVKTGDKAGLDMTDIYWKKKDAESKCIFDGSANFDYEELAHAFEFLLEEKLIYKLGATSERYVHYLVSVLVRLKDAFNPLSNF